jgi:hypothetical protein
MIDTMNPRPEITGLTVTVEVRNAIRARMPKGQTFDEALRALFLDATGVDLGPSPLSRNGRESARTLDATEARSK